MDGHVVVRENRDASGGFFYSGMTLPEYRAGDNTFAGRALVDVFDLSAMELRDQDRRAGSRQRRRRTEGDDSSRLAARTSSFNGSVATIAGAAQTNFWEMTGPMRQFDATLKVDQPDLASAAGLIGAGRDRRAARRERPAAAAAGRAAEGRQADRLRADRRPGSRRAPVKVTYRTESRVGIEGLDEGAVIALGRSAVGGARAARSPRAAPASGAVK